VAITWTDVFQGALMLLLVLGAALAVLWTAGSPFELMRRATAAAPELGRLGAQPQAAYVGYFIIWATAIPVIPHVVMRVYTARDPRGARLSLNLAMLAYSAMILAAVLAIVPVGKLGFPGLADADEVFLRVIESGFPPVVRGVAVSAVLAAVMSTTYALLLACSGAVAHDLLEGVFRVRVGERGRSAIRVATTWVVGLLALYWALSPPELITRFYTAGIGLLSAGLFVPTIAGLWWRRANRLGGTAALVAGLGTYLLSATGVVQLGLAPILPSLGASALGMWVGGHVGRPETKALLSAVEHLHAEEAAGE